MQSKTEGPSPTDRQTDQDDGKLWMEQRTNEDKKIVMMKLWW